jgi:hypothetical protein
MGPSGRRRPGAAREQQVMELLSVPSGALASRRRDSQYWSRANDEVRLSEASTTAADMHELTKRGRPEHDTSVHLDRRSYGWQRLTAHGAGCSQSRLVV